MTKSWWTRPAADAMLSAMSTTFLDATPALTLKALHTRFLYPFFFDASTLDAATTALLALRHREHGVWRLEATPHELYRQELLSTVEQFLFPAGDGACRYLRGVEATVDGWLRSPTLVEYPDREKSQVPLAWIPGVQIELFLSSNGVGLLSLGVQPDLRRIAGQQLAPDAAKWFNYRLAQQLSKKTPTLFIPHPRDDPEKSGRFNPNTPEPPAVDAPFSERLGALGGRFTLPELVEFLLSPLQPRPAQGSFSLYTVARFDATARLDREEARARLGPFLSGLAQIEEPTHVGALTGEVDVEQRILNSHHWAGVGFLGAAHLVMDQDPPHQFDEQRMPSVRDKYFVPYLLASLQRLILARIRDEAPASVRPRDDQQPQFDTTSNQLHEDLLNFAVSGDFFVVSSREALNRFYTLARQGLRVPEALDNVRRALVDLDAAQQARQQLALTHSVNDSLQTVAGVQRKVEWLEVFFVSFYSAELSHILAESFGFAHSYTAWTTLSWAMFGGGLAFVSLQPWKHGHSEHGKKPEKKEQPGRWRLALPIVLVTLLVALWLAYGLWSRPHSSAHATPSSPHAQIPADDLLAKEQITDRAEGQERPEGERGLAVGTTGQHHPQANQ